LHTTWRAEAHRSVGKKATRVVEQSRAFRTHVEKHALFATSLPSSSAWSSFTYLQCEHYARNRTMHQHAQRAARSVRESPPRCIKRGPHLATRDNTSSPAPPSSPQRRADVRAAHLRAGSINPLRMTHVHTRAHAHHLTDSFSRTFGASAAGPQMAKARDAQVGEVMPACVAPFALCRAALVRLVARGSDGLWVRGPSASVLRWVRAAGCPLRPTWRPVDGIGGPVVQPSPSFVRWVRWVRWIHKSLHQKYSHWLAATYLITD
jgi:hypothetical protein